MDLSSSTECNSSQNSNDTDGVTTNISEPCSPDSEEYEEEVDETDYNRKLKERLLSLRSTMQDLKKQLKEEKDHWKKEMEHAKLYANKANDAGDSSVHSYHYEFEQQRFQDHITQAHQESRANLQREIAINNYKRRLMEVENMCNMELLRVKQNVQFLQPLQLIASEWNCSKTASFNESGDTMCEKTESSLTSLATTTSEENKSKEAAVPLERVGNKFYNDMNDMFSKISVQCSESVSQLAAGNWGEENKKNQNHSSTWCNECMTKQN